MPPCAQFVFDVEILFFVIKATFKPFSAQRFAKNKPAIPEPITAISTFGINSSSPPPCMLLPWHSNA